MVSRTSLDRELLLSELGTDSVTLEVVVTDNGIPKLSDTATITVTLLDENDSKPTFSKVRFLLVLKIIFLVKQLYFIYHFIHMFSFLRTHMWRKCPSRRSRARR